MKCPKCNYVSFDNLKSCRKCSFVFKKSNNDEPLFTDESPFSEIDSENEEIIQKGKSPDMSKTVASIKESLDEIAEGTSNETGSGSQGQSVQIESDGVQLEEAKRTAEENQIFPTHGEINWEESISISSDELNIDTGVLSGEAGEIRFEDGKTEVPYEKTEIFKKEMKKVGEELKQIEEETEKPEPAHLSESSDMSHDLSTVRKGGFWIRFSALIIDNVVLYALSFILTVVGMIALGMGSSGLEELGQEDIYTLVIPLYIFNTILTITYYTYFHGSTGQTPGKMVCKLKVVQVNGEPLGYGKAFLRLLGYIISSFIFCLGFLWAAWDKNKQAWHDKIAGTYVIRIT